MKTLIVGGTGALGGHIAARLKERGHDVTIAARTPPEAGTPMADMPFLQGDYVAGDFTPDKLKGFDWVVFAAGNDPRHIPRGSDADAHLFKANHEAAPAFFRACREAGVKRAIQLGSFYPQASPELIAGNKYIQSRKAACEGARAEATDDFHVISVNAPFMVGCVPGQSSQLFQPYVQWAEGTIPLPATAPAGGTNFMSFRSLSEAVEGALERGENRKAYLVGDENLSFADYFGLFFAKAGNEATMEAKDEPHPMLPDVAIPQGRGNYIRYEPDAAETALLGYRRNDVANAVAEAVRQYGSGKA